MTETVDLRSWAMQRLDALLDNWDDTSTNRQEASERGMALSALEEIEHRTLQLVEDLESRLEEVADAIGTPKPERLPTIGYGLEAVNDAVATVIEYLGRDCK